MPEEEELCACDCHPRGSIGLKVLATPAEPQGVVCVSGIDRELADDQVVDAEHHRHWEIQELAGNQLEGDQLRAQRSRRRPDGLPWNA